jgi:MFS family permease
MSTAEALVDTRPQPSKMYRWLVLIFVSLAMFGNYYFYDALSPVADLLTKQLGFTDANIGLLQGIYSFPNIFTVVIGGIIIDRIGLRRATLIYGVLCFFGAVINVVSAKLWIMAAGRLIFGMGAESLIVAVTVALAMWFKGKELSFAFGMNLTFARLGSFAALNSPSWARAAYSNWRYPFLIGVGMCSMCVVGALIYWGMDAYAEKHYAMAGEAQTDKVEFKDLFVFDTSYWYFAALCIVLLSAKLALKSAFPSEVSYWHILALCAGLYLGKVVLRAVFKIGISYAYIVALCIVFYSAIFPFQTFAVKFFEDAHGTTREFGGFLSSTLTLFAMIATPLFGLLVDKVGKRALFMMFGSLLLIPVYIIMGYTHVNLYVPMLMMGVAFSLIPAVMWPAVAYIVDPARLGTAYGVMTMIQNIGLFGFNLLIGWANTYSHADAANPNGYRLGMLIFSVLGFLGMMFAFLLHHRETGPHGHGLETITASSKT